MRHWHAGPGILLACFLGLAAEARAGNFGGFSAGFATDGSVGAGFGGIAQQCATPLAGCIGSAPASGMIGMCGFGGCTGGFGCSIGGCLGGHPCSFGGCLGCSFGGCFGTVPCSFSGFCGGFSTSMPTQTYSKWSPSANKTYYFRILQVQTPPPNDLCLEFILVHYPDRPKFFYFYDPVDKKYFGRYLLGARPENCFNLLNVNDRQTNLKDIPESAFRHTAGMPTVTQVLRPRTGTVIDGVALQNLKLQRPPESIPDELLGLPPEEPTLKKSVEKR